MKKQLQFACASLLIGFSAHSQVDSTAAAPENPWKLKSLFGLNGTQSSFVNWSAGGRNNLSVIGFISASADYSKNKWQWKTNLDLALGGMLYLDAAGKKQGLQKTDDKIDFATNLGYKMANKWYVSFVGGFRTQFLDGFNMPNDSVRVSTFMAPGYANLALGIDFTPTEHLSMFLSPIALKMTFVNDKTLADAGAFGVQDAIFNTAGDVVSSGKRFRGEIGAYFRFVYNKEVAKNVNLKSKLELFSNYANNPQNIDVNADMLWTFKVNTWLSASLSWTLIYDDDISITDSKGRVGPRTQFKSVLGLGLSYSLQNFKEK
jgi:hypothetical protein